MPNLGTVSKHVSQLLSTYLQIALTTVASYKILRQSATAVSFSGHYEERVIPQNAKPIIVAGACRIRPCLQCTAHAHASLSMSERCVGAC